MRFVFYFIILFSLQPVVYSDVKDELENECMIQTGREISIVEAGSFPVFSSHANFESTSFVQANFQRRQKLTAELNPLWYGSWKSESIELLISANYFTATQNATEEKCAWLGSQKYPKREGCWAVYGKSSNGREIALAQADKEDAKTKTIQRKINQSDRFKMIVITYTDAQGQEEVRGDCFSSFFYDKGSVFHKRDCQLGTKFTISLEKLVRR
jgi:hypothetical protein